MRGLNMWQRLGLVLTVLWVFGGGTYELIARSTKASETVDWMFKVCRDSVELRHSDDFKSCYDAIPKNLAIWREGIWADVAIFAILPPSIIWLVAILTLRTVTWILAGKQNSKATTRSI